MAVSVRYATDDDRWAAVAGRDVRADGAFLYAVGTTGVYCRPTCPSRLPNRANVRFFPTCEQAERGGYRACKKCRPGAAAATPDAVRRACEVIDGAAEPPTLAAVAAAVGLSPCHFHRLFTAAVGVTPKGYADARRAEKFRAGLRGGRTVTAAMYAAGFGSSSRCYEGVGDMLGMTPTEYRGGGGGRAVRYAVAECPLGWVAVAATDRGVCLIAVGDAPPPLRAEVVARFPDAAPDDRGGELTARVELAVRQVGPPPRAVELPRDVQGTAFQRRVWEALTAGPPGAAVVPRRRGRR